VSETILYVVDDDLNRTVFAAACGDDFDVVTAESGARALEILAERDVGVVVADQRMPLMTGVELLERVAHDHPETVRILITAFSDMGVAIDAINRGHVRRYVRKPWEPEELRATLREAVEVHAVRRKLEELERRLREAERVYALGVAAAFLAHDLRTPATTLLGYLELAAADLQRVRAECQNGREEAALASLRAAFESVASASRSAHAMADIVTGMNLGQRSAAQASTDDPAEVVRLTVRSLHGTLRRRARLEMDVRPCPAVSGSTTQLSQVVSNLLVNAFEALPADQPAVNRVIVRLLPDGGRVRLDVEDTGCGIPAEVQEAVFRPFFTTKAEGGTGLGLAITKQIVEDIGGEIAVESAAGHGTRFSVFLPPVTGA
jgi:two-component system, NtrC family, sensor kinase